MHIVTRLCVALARGRARWRRELAVATVRGLGALKLDAVLLPVIALVRAISVVTIVVIVVGG